jgi:hypothetical protein
LAHILANKFTAHDFMKTLTKEVDQADIDQTIKKAFDLFKIKEQELPRYTDPEQFGRNFKRCDRMEYAHTRYSVTSSANE